MGHGAAPLQQVVDEVEQPRVGEVVVLEDHHHGRRGGQTLEEGAPSGEELLGAGRAALHSKKRQQGRLDPASLELVGDVRGERLGDLRARGQLVVALEQAAAHAHHLAQGPEADPLPVGRGAPVVRPDRLDQPVEVLVELPGEAALADACRTDDRHKAGTAVARGSVEEILQLAQLVVAPDEGGFEALAAVAPADLGHHAQGAPGGHGCHPAFERLLADLLESDGPAGSALGRLPHEDGPRWGHRLEAAGRIHKIARHHALVRSPDGHRGLAGQDPCAGLDRRAERLHRVEELEARPHGALGVVLPGRGGTPHGHHCVADELLHRAAVALDHLAGELEVAGEELAGLFRVAALGECGEAHEVSEEN